MAGRRKWKVGLLSGRAAAAGLLTGLFALGSVVGCVAAGLIRDPEGELMDYVRGYLALAAEDGLAPDVLAVLWQVVRIPMLTAVLGFTALGVVGIPVLFVIRGFALSYSVSAFYRLLGAVGLVPGLILFGLSALLWLPVLMELGGQGVLGAYGLLRRAMGDTRYSLGGNGGFLARCSVCAAVLCLCAGIECVVVPKLLQVIAGLILTG